MKTNILLFFLVVTINGFSQNKTDSLRKLIRPVSDTIQVNNLNSLAKEFISSNVDSALHYSSIAFERAEKALFPKGKVKSLMIRANVYRKNGLVDSVLKSYEKALDIGTSNNLIYERGEINMWMGYTHQNQAAFDKSLACLIEAEKFFTRAGNKKMLGRNLWLMGNTYLKLKSFSEAEKSFEKAKGFFAAAGDSLGYFDCVQNTAILYTSQEKFEKALPLLIESERFYRKVNHVGALSAALVNKSEVLLNINRYDEAEKVVLEALELKKIVGVPSGIAFCYGSLGEINLDKKNYNKAEDYFKSAIEYARKDNSLEVIVKSYKALCLVYKGKGDFQKALQFHEYYYALNDSMYNNEKSRTIEEMKTRFDTEKKDKELLLKDAQLEKQNVEARQKAFQRNALIVGLVLMLVLAAFIFRSLNEKKKSNKIILQQKHLVEEKQKEILDSINYARKIQYALLAHDEFMSSRLNKYFVLFQPKDIVSGDFYWATVKENKFYLAVCDSTGHGVPGAFMSLLNISFLNEAINERNILKPNEIFNYVRQRLTDSISKDGQQDGFDGVLMCIDASTKTVSYAAANNAPVVVKNNLCTELGKDRMPVGISEQNPSFTEFQIDYNSFDTLYLYTDGFADQFGGPKGKKFKYKQLNESLVQISSDSFEDQKLKLKEIFERWRGNLEQVDDVCIVGISLCNLF